MADKEMMMKVLCEPVHIFRRPAMRAMIRRFIRDEEAATAIEYALIAGLIGVVIATALTPIGTQIKTILESILTALGGKAG